MLSKVAQPHFFLILFFGILVAIIGVAQSLVLIHFSVEEPPAFDPFLFQGFSGRFDIFFFVLTTLLALGLLPGDIASGLIRHYLTVPSSRRLLFNQYVLLSCQASGFLLAIYSLCLVATFCVTQSLWPSLSSLLLLCL